MNSKGIVVISVIVISLVGIAYMSSTQQFDESMTPSIESNLSVDHDTSLSLTYPDSPVISHSNSVDESDVVVTVDEDGKKQYSIEVGDTPIIQE
ncbi:hypothetical protein [Nitrosopumilus maritimus]|uniref:Uncharacterized protein n=1 Tax=Nitrosopumilus maritimus (strain SCM1) TaxID=436308 RepID=A9A164_NITMS|nr:hypothetical protein [Nitrosopumilus maritimus]ABX12350.1 hypothetical protein Nmar_0454 [Nitrosopumilus maritimus SCM1]